MRKCLLPLLAALGLAACASGPAQVAGNGSVTFLHLNDTYRVAAVEEGRRGGFGRVATLVRSLEAEGRDVRILHAGDFLYPSLESQIWEGRQMVDAMNFLDDLAPLHAVPGNHEFDPDEPDDVVLRVKESRFDWLGDNLRLVTGDSEADAAMQRAFVFRSGDRTIGIFALTMRPEDGGNDRAWTPFDEQSYVAAAEQTIRALKAKGADAVIGLTHLHLADDIEIAKLKARFPEFVFIAGGHEHEPEFAAPTEQSALVVKGASNARTIWRIDLSFVNGAPAIDARRIEVDETIAVDDEYRERISNPYRGELLARMPYLTAHLGEAAVPLDGREVTMRNEDSNWGTFIADRMRGAFGRRPSDFAFLNGGTLRIDDYIAEDITWEDIARTFGFPTTLHWMEMRGSDFRKLLEAGYRGFGPSKGYFPQVSGFRICVDRSRPDGDRIVQLQVPTDDGWREIEDDRVYSLVAPDYIFRGGDGYDFSAAMNATPRGSELKYLVIDAITEAQKRGESVGAGIAAGNRRFMNLPQDRTACFAQ